MDMRTVSCCELASASMTGAVRRRLRTGWYESRRERSSGGVDRAGGNRRVVRDRHAAGDLVGHRDARRASAYLEGDDAGIATDDTERARLLAVAQRPELVRAARLECGEGARQVRAPVAQQDHVRERGALRRRERDLAGPGLPPGGPGRGRELVVAGRPAARIGDDDG